MKVDDEITPNADVSDQLMTGPSYLALTLLAVLSTLFLLGYHLWQTHTQALESAAIESGNLAWVLEERLDTTFRRIDSDLLQIANKVTSAKLTLATGRTDISIWTDYLAEFRTNFPEVEGYYVFDASGELVASSAPHFRTFSIADRDHFHRLRDTPSATLIFSDVLTSRTTGRPMMVVGRALRHQDGRFIGIVSATVDLDYFQKIFDSIKIGDHGAMGLMRSDTKKLVLRYPEDPSDYNKVLISKQGQRISAGDKVGVERYRSSVDKVLRIGTFRVLPNFPFFVNVAIAETDALAEWRTIAWGSVIGSMIFLLALGFLQMRLWRAEQLRRSAIQNLARIAQIDELTKLPNRHNFLMRAEEELSRTLRYGGSLSVLMMDIDNFKSVNDTYGHRTGDIVLRKLAELCQQSMRTNDIVGRIGGEEFAFVLPNAEIALGVEVAERMRKAIENAMIETEDGRLMQITVSIGVSALAHDDTSIDRLLSQADKGLYEAKHAGRNRVCVYGA